MSVGRKSRGEEKGGLRGVERRRKEKDEEK